MKGGREEGRDRWMDGFFDFRELDFDFFRLCIINIKRSKTEKNGQSF